MSLILAARFNTFAEAQNTADRLFVEGLDESDISIFFVNAPGQNHSLPLGGDEYADRNARNASRTVMVGASLGAVLGGGIGSAIVVATGISFAAAVCTGGIGAYFGSLLGAMLGMRDKVRPHEKGKSLSMRHGGVMLAVRVDRPAETRIAQILEASGGMDVEQASGEWRAGRWVDFDPARPPQLSDKVEPHETV